MLRNIPEKKILNWDQQNRQREIEKTKTSLVLFVSQLDLEQQLPSFHLNNNMIHSAFINPELHQLRNKSPLAASLGFQIIYHYISFINKLRNSNHNIEG